MKFVIKDSAIEKEKLVEISLEKDSGGDITLVANNRPILYLTPDGVIYRYTIGEIDLTERGFQSTGDGKVKIYGVDK